MKLTTLLASINTTVAAEYHAVVVLDLQTDSRKINQGALFIAVAGTTADGSEYIQQAIANGAIAVLQDAKVASIDNRKINDIPIFAIENLKSKIGILASCFFGNPSERLNIVGVTGTNGKSSTCHYIAEILRNLSHPSATIGTLGVGTPAGYQPTQNTTPGAPELQQILANLEKNNVRTVAMEVSSHALVQERVNGIHFNTAVFTNLSQDHLDYHQNMANYWQAKLKLFSELQPKNVVVNLDDEHGRQLLTLLDKNINVLGYSILGLDCFASLATTELQVSPELQGNRSILTASEIKYTENGIAAKLSSSFGTKTLEIPLIGKFNLSNMLAAIASCLLQGCDFNAIVAALTKVQGIPGRMQYIRTKSNPLAVVDYAHTPDALERVLTTLQYYCRGKLWCVFGCGGDRDRLKRTQMLAVAKKYSDWVIITQDNPRTEDPKQILADTIKNHQDDSSIIIELDRRAAIELAISKAASIDVVLIAGKGHENYQIIGTQQLPFSDVAVVENYMHNKSCIT